MAIEDHPQFEAWSRALDQLKDAKDRLRESIADGRSAALLVPARRDVTLARGRFESINEEIGYA